MNTLPQKKLTKLLPELELPSHRWAHLPPGHQDIHWDVFLTFSVNQMVNASGSEIVHLVKGAECIAPTATARAAIAQILKVWLEIDTVLCDFFGDYLYEGEITQQLVDKTPLSLLQRAIVEHAENLFDEEDTASRNRATEIGNMVTYFVRALTRFTLNEMERFDQLTFTEVATVSTPAA